MFFIQHSPFQWGPGTEVIARYNFKANSEEDLTFSKGDVLTIMAATPVSICLSKIFFMLIQLKTLLDIPSMVII